MKVIGLKPSNFDTPDGKHIEGFNLYCVYPMSGDKGIGDCAERIYLTLDKLVKCGYTPKVGDEINVTYNRFGKPETINLVM